MPRLTDVFVLREAGVQSLAQRYKVPLALAQEVNSFDVKNADAQMAVLVSRAETQAVDAAKLWSALVHMGESAWPTLLKAYLGRFPAKKTETVRLAVDDWGEFLHALIEFKGELKDDVETKTVVKLPNGMRWVSISGDAARSREGTRMQHCGQAVGDMYSLRDANGKPHVTADVGDERDLVQCRGKQNDAPDRRYWPAVEALMRHLGVTWETLGRGVGDSATEGPMRAWLSDRLGRAGGPT